ncbi:hypothetical protein C7957_10656 [Halanaerobium saccharolyticum]|uniref:PilX-like prepilin protein n=2 Tax=Halanaerobium saccharolyticum TaxID=43595 RepID=A0A4R6SAS7_9FIRM|nr:hypothetical protein C7957_10656 [Halanaerobium saccharolyticum]
MKTIRNNDGFALVASIILIAILLVLITVLVNISLAEYRQAERNKNDVKAYFLARSGADLMANYIINNESDASALLETGKDYNLRDGSENFISTINILNKTTKNYEISSNAEINGVSKTVKVNIKKYDLFDTAIFAKSNLDFSKMEDLDLNDANINVETNGDNINDPENFIPDEQEITNSTKEFKSIDWDTNPTIQELVNNDPTGKEIIDDTISESGYYKDVTYTNGTLTVDFGDKDTINIAVDNFDFKADMNFIPADDLTNRHLNLYVKESITFQTPNVEIPNLNIFLMKDSEITLIANSDLPDEKGIFVYGPEATMVMQSNKTHFAGGIIVDSFEGQGNLAMGSYTYQPFSTEDMEYIEDIIDNKFFINSWSR